MLLLKIFNVKLIFHNSFKHFVKNNKKISLDLCLITNIIFLLYISIKGGR